MYLTEIAEAVKEAIEEIDDWTGLKVPDDIEPVLAVDPLVAFNGAPENPYIYILVDTIDYDFQDSNRRQVVVDPKKIKSITIQFVRQITQKSDNTYDITTWEHGRGLVDMMEDVANNFLQKDWGRLKLVGLEPSLPENILMDNRWFVLSLICAFEEVGW